MIKYEISVDLTSADKFVEYLKSNMKTLSRLILQRLAERIVSYIQVNKLSGQVLKIRTGRLRASMGYKLAGDTAVDIGDIGSNVVYARIHEFGGIIRPKRAKYLRFRTPDGRWHTVSQVTMPARPYLQPSVEEYFGSGKADELTNLTMQEFIGRAP